MFSTFGFNNKSRQEKKLHYYCSFVQSPDIGDDCTWTTTAFFRKESVQLPFKQFKFSVLFKSAKYELRVINDLIVVYVNNFSLVLFGYVRKIKFMYLLFHDESINFFYEEVITEVKDQIAWFSLRYILKFLTTIFLLTVDRFYL